MAENQMISQAFAPEKTLSWAEVREIRKLHREGYTIRRLSELFEVPYTKVSYAIYTKRSPKVVHLHRVLGQRGSKKSRANNRRINISLWGHLVCMCLKRHISCRGFSAIELASTLKTAGRLSQSERDILDDVCAEYGITFDELPVSGPHFPRYIKNLELMR